MAPTTDPPTIDPQAPTIRADLLRRASNVLVMLTDLDDPTAAAEIVRVWASNGHTWGEFAAEGAAGIAVTNLQTIVELSVEQVAAGNCDPGHLLAAARRAQAALALGVVVASDHARQAVTA